MPRGAALRLTGRGRPVPHEFRLLFSDCDQVGGDGNGDLLGVGIAAGTDVVDFVVTTAANPRARSVEDEIAGGRCCAARQGDSGRGVAGRVVVDEFARAADHEHVFAGTVGEDLTGSNGTLAKISGS